MLKFIILVIIAYFLYRTTLSAWLKRNATLPLMKSVITFTTMSPEDIGRAISGRPGLANRVLTESYQVADGLRTYLGNVSLVGEGTVPGAKSIYVTSGGVPDTLKQIWRINGKAGTHGEGMIIVNLRFTDDGYRKTRYVRVPRVS